MSYAVTARWDAPFICCEDWGWWVELKTAPFAFGVCIYCGPEKEGLLDLYCTDGATARKKWSWRRFQFVDTTPYVSKLHDDLLSIFRADHDVQVLATDLDSPFVDDDSEPRAAVNGVSGTQPRNSGGPGGRSSVS